MGCTWDVKNNNNKNHSNQTPTPLFGVSTQNAQCVGGKEHATKTDTGARDVKVLWLSLLAAI